MATIGAASFHSLSVAVRTALVSVRGGEWDAWDRVADRGSATLEHAQIGALVRSRAEELTAQERFDLLRRAPDVQRLPESDPTALAAFAHVRITLGFVPLVPLALVSWTPPTRYGYRDLGAPVGLADLLVRLEDLERSLWRLAGHRPATAAELRRLYAFWESGVLWTARELAHGVEPPL